MPLGVLLATVQTEVGAWDTADLQTAAWIAGIPYPTGFPGYVLLGWLWTHALPIGSVAARVNALSALAIATGSASVCALALLFDVMAPLAVLAGWLFALAHPVWTRATYADAHPLGFAVAFVALALTTLWTLRGERRALVAAIVLAGMALAIDNTTVLILAGAIAVACGRRAPLRPVTAAAALAVLLALAAYAYLPLRSAQIVAQRLDPTLAIGIPPGRPYWDDHDPRTASGFVRLVTGTDFEVGAALPGLFAPSALAATLAQFGPDLAADLPQGLPIVALGGYAVVLARSPWTGAGLGLAALLPALFGASYPAESDPFRYAFTLYGVLALGVAVGADRTVRAFAHRGDAAVPLTVASALVALAVGHEFGRGRDLFAARSDDGAATFASRIAAHTDDRAIVVADWSYASTLAYAAYVDRRFGRRIVVCAHPADERERYAAWRRTRQVAIVSDNTPRIRGVHVRLLAKGDPSLYEVVR